MYHKKLLLIISVFLILLPKMVLALNFPVPKNNEIIIGNVQNIQLQASDDYPTIAQRYDVGYYELYEANPGFDPDYPQAGNILIIPTQYILPPELHNNIVINLAEMRLYYESAKLNKIFIYPIGIGQEGWNTPLGTFRVTQKIKNPVWTVPDDIYKYRIEHGIKVAKKVPSGPDNPLGYFAMRLSNPTYLIHGTNDPVGVGRRSSGGCIRMYPKDIEQLFAMTDSGTEVKIINNPYKAAKIGNKFYLEAHMPLYEQRVVMQDDVSAAINNVKMLGSQYNKYIDWEKVKTIATEHLGVPRVIGEVGTATPITQPIANKDDTQTKQPNICWLNNIVFYDYLLCKISQSASN